MLLNLLAKLLAVPRVSSWLIERAKRTPDESIGDYMDRYWLFNQYDRESRVAKYPRIPFSIRIHNIRREDDPGRHVHDHPWNARTFLLRGAYVEVRPDGEPTSQSFPHPTEAGQCFWRRAGDTCSLKFNEFHRIEWVSPAGVWTLFVMFEYRGVWGFLVDGVKVGFKEYLATYKGDAK